MDIAIFRVAAVGEDSDEALRANISAEADATVTLEQLQRALAKIPGSLVDDFASQRDERF